MSQLPASEKLQGYQAAYAACGCRAVIENDGSISELASEIERAMERLGSGRDEWQACQPSLASPPRQLSVRNIVMEKMVFRG